MERYLVQVDTGMRFAVVKDRKRPGTRVRLTPINAPSDEKIVESVAAAKVKIEQILQTHGGRIVHQALKTTLLVETTEKAHRRSGNWPAL